MGNCLHSDSSQAKDCIDMLMEQLCKLLRGRFCRENASVEHWIFVKPSSTRAVGFGLPDSRGNVLLRTTSSRRSSSAKSIHFRSSVISFWAPLLGAAIKGCSNNNTHYGTTAFNNNVSHLMLGRFRFTMSVEVPMLYGCMLFFIRLQYFELTEINYLTIYSYL